MLCTVMGRGRSDFERFVGEVEPRVRRALVAGFGSGVGGLAGVGEADQATLIERLAENGDTR